MSGLVESLLAVLFGAASALVPVLNAEVYAVASAGRAGLCGALFVAVALACGQTAGKLVLFEAARRGSIGFTRQHALRSARTRRWADRTTRFLRSRRTGHPLVLASAAFGLPPLAAVSLAAGAAGQRRWEFAVVCLFGRTARFAALVLSAAWALS
jgi:membrane protein YqaA with SNARE-associated domain